MSLFSFFRRKPGPPSKPTGPLSPEKKAERAAIREKYRAYHTKEARIARPDKAA